MAVARHPIKGGRSLVGFYHAQDHLYNGSMTDPAGEAWKFVGVAYSDDEGETWSDGGIVLSSFVPKPEVPAWGGLGDFGAVWDWRAQHWKCYFKEQQRLGVAISTDPDARPGSFFKWRWLGASGTMPDVSDWPAGTMEPPGAEWESPGIGGVYTGLPGLNDVPGSNPGIHWNTVSRSEAGEMVKVLTPSVLLAVPRELGRHLEFVEHNGARDHTQFAVHRDVAGWPAFLDAEGFVDPQVSDVEGVACDCDFGRGRVGVCREKGKAVSFGLLDYGYQ
jgi:hypothetical protein